MEPVKDDVMMLLPRCDVDLSLLLEMIPSLLHGAVAGVGDREEGYQVLARLQDDIVEVKKTLVQARAKWNKQ